MHMHLYSVDSQRAADRAGGMSYLKELRRVEHIDRKDKHNQRHESNLQNKAS